MEQHLFILLFLTGVSTLLPYAPRKYYLIKQTKTWADARNNCRSIHTDLATIENDDDMIQLQTEAENHQFRDTAWIGLYNDVNSWHWSLGNESLGSTRFWYPSQPCNYYGNEECAVINRDGWHDAPCTWTYPFACYDDRNNDTGKYIVYSNTKQWYDAQAFCRQTHTDLASARNETEQSVIVGKTSGWTWFGLCRDSWKWLNPINISSTKWMPASKSNNHYCGYFYNGQTYGGYCLDMRPSFCYREVTGQQQIIRVKVQSDQDVNDPVVMAAILEQMKETLKRNGVKNFKVKWREPDGKIFYKLKIK